MPSKYYLILVSMLHVIILSGCKGTAYKDFGYVTAEQEFGGATVHAKLRGTDSNGRNGISNTRGAPYSLLLWVDLPKAKEDCIATFLNTSLINRETMSRKNIINKSVSVKASKSYDDVIKAYFSVKDLFIPFVDHEINSTINFTDSCGLRIKEYTFHLVMETHYEERNITFWDSLMGI